VDDVTFPDGTRVRGAGLHDRDRNAGWRDRGLYLDTRWAPDWPAEVVGWPDFGVPEDPPTARRAIHRAFVHARSGERVEVGCAAGQGRTGTVLACMAVLSGVPPSGAVDWVRRNYSPHAVETSAQAAWVHDFAVHAAAEGWLEGHHRSVGSDRSMP
jgi:hypothetical protein